MPTRILVATILAAALPFFSTVGATPETPAQAAGHRVVIHINSGDEKVQQGALNNIRHLYQELGPEHLAVEVIAHGAGLSLLMKSKTPFMKDVTALTSEYGVRFTACSNTMKAMHLTRADLVSEVGDTVPAILRLLERQEQGWAYIKP